jgi:hypothetical protein
MYNGQELGHSDLRGIITVSLSPSLLEFSFSFQEVDHLVQLALDGNDRLLSLARTLQHAPEEFSVEVTKLLTERRNRCP